MSVHIPAKIVLIVVVPASLLGTCGMLIGGACTAETTPSHADVTSQLTDSMLSTFFGMIGGVVGLVVGSVVGVLLLLALIFRTDDDHKETESSPKTSYDE